MQQTLSGLRYARQSWACALLGVALLAACDNGPQTAATVTLSVPSTNLVVGQHVTITPTVKDAGGKVLIGRTVQYTSSAPAVVSVTSDGEAFALSPGSGTITATVEAATANLGIVVAPLPVDKVVVTPATASFAAATSKQFTATPLDAAGNALFDRAVSWSVNDTSIATVDATGMVSGKKAGSAVLTATIEGKSAQAQLTLTPAAVNSIELSPANSSIMEGGTLRLTAIARDVNGRVIANPTLTWRSSATNVATVDNTGLVTAVANGYANIIVNGGGAFGSAIVFVSPLVIGSVVISPDSARLDIGATTQLTATVKDTAGNVVTTRPVTWSSLNTAIATVSATGLVTAVATGSAGIVAAREGKADTVTINVNPLPVASISISPTSGVLGLARSGPFAATPLDSAGHVSLRPVSWRVADNTIASVDSTGTVTGLAVGSTTVYATAGAKTIGAALSVVTTTVSSVSVGANAATIAVGGTVQIVATARAADLSALPNRLIRYTSIDPTVATVDASGLVHGIARGNTGITVSCEGQIALVTIAAN